MDTPLEEIRSYIGKPASSLPTPSVILNRQIIEKNCKEMIENVKSKGLGFRPHVKTTKVSFGPKAAFGGDPMTILWKGEEKEVTRLMLGGYTKKVVASTLREIRGLADLVDSGEVDEILYGIPFHPNALPQLHAYSQKATIVLMVDHINHLTLLEDFNKTHTRSAPWPVFIKLDVGTHRAGVPLPSSSDPSSTPSRLQTLITAVETSPTTNLLGFYCHAGHSYSSTGEYEASKILEQEVTSLNEAVDIVAAISSSHNTSKERTLILSLGETPTAHVISTLKVHSTSSSSLRAQYELHGGNYPINDLQQLATNLVSEKDIALRVIASLCSIYPERNEALINAGVLAISREPGRIEGFGKVVSEGKEGWYLKKLSQEHGVLAFGGKDGEGKKVVAEETWRIGESVFLFVQHACITAAGHGWYFVVDGEDDVVRDVWVPWKGW